MDYTNHSPLFLCLYILLFFCLSCIRCYGLKIFAKQNPKTKSDLFLILSCRSGWWWVTLSSSSSSCDLWRVVSSEDSHMEKSIEQHLHANERGSCCGCCFVMRACKDSTSINLHEAICQSRTPLWATRGWGRRGGDEMGFLQGWGDDTCEQIVSTFSIKLGF